MFRRISLSVLWLLAVWTWVNMAHVFLGLPDLGLLAGCIAAAVILARGLIVAGERPRVIDRAHGLAKQRS